jgi:hypothetical protein
MEYWNNPIKKYTWPTTEDPIAESMHNGAHCLFYDPSVHKDTITYQQSLQDICDWANRSIKQQGIDKFIDDKLNWYDIANVVKLNLWVDDIRKQGIVKPMMLFYPDGEKLGINNGESRLRACTCIPELTHVKAFISTSVEHRAKFEHLEEINTLKQFAKKCHAVIGQEFRFTMTDPLAPYGVFWYEYNSAKTAPVTPGEDTCVDALRNYLNSHPDIVFTIDWFSNIVDWSNYLDRSSS